MSCNPREQACGLQSPGAGFCGAIPAKQTYGLQSSARSKLMGYNPRREAGLWVAIPGTEQAYGLQSPLRNQTMVSNPRYLGFWVAIPSLAAGFWLQSPSTQQAYG